MLFNIYFQFSSLSYFPSFRHWLYGWGFMRLGRKETPNSPPVEYRYLMSGRLLGLQVGLVLGHGQQIRTTTPVVNGGSSG